MEIINENEDNLDNKENEVNQLASVESFLDNKLHDTMVNMIKREVKNIINPKPVYTISTIRYNCFFKRRDIIPKATSFIKGQNY